MRVPALMLLLFAVATLGACDDCGSSPDASLDATGPSGTVVGRVISPHVGGLDVVPRAVVIHPSGVRVVAGDDGSFVLAGVPVGPATLRIEGPRAAEPDHPLSYAPGFATVEVVVDTEVAIEPALLLGCERSFDPSVANVLPLRGCGADRGSLELPAGAIADDAGVFTGRVSAEIAVVDPAAAGMQVLALSPPPTAEPVELAAGVSVRLRDAATGAPLHLAPDRVARLRLPITTAAATISLAWRDDDGAITARPELAATTSQDASGTYAVLDVAHFSSYILYWAAGWRTTAELRVRGWIGSANSCSAGCIISSTSGQDVNPTCAGTVCVNDSTSVDVRWGTGQVHGTAGTPIRVPSDTQVRVRLRHTNALARTVGGTPIYDSGWFGLWTPPAGQRAEVGPIAVPAVPEGCAMLTLSAGACSGPLRVYRGGELIQASYGDFCAAAGACVMLPASGDQGLFVETPGGRRVTLDGNPAFGQSCGGGSCTTLGASPPTPPLIGASIAVTHRHNIALTTATPATGDPGVEFVVDLDGATSTGPIDTFAWTVFAIESGAELPIWNAAGAATGTTVGLDAGTYRVRLRGYGGRGQWDETTTTVSLGGSPTDPVASFTVNPAAPAAGSSFELNASASTAASSIVSYAWDLDGNGTFESTQGHPITHYYFATPGPRAISLRVTDDQQRTSQTTRTVTVTGDTNSVTITVNRAGNTVGAYVISVPAGIACSEGTGAVCTATFPRGTSMHLDAYVSGTPAQSAWGEVPGADGYQLFLGNVQADRSVTATFP